VFIADDDCTHTVRFHVKARTGPLSGARVPDSVTVDKESLVHLNSGTPEWLFANAYGVFSQPSNVLWVAYAGRPFVQFVRAGDLLPPHLQHAFGHPSRDATPSSRTTGTRFASGTGAFLANCSGASATVGHSVGSSPRPCTV